MSESWNGRRFIRTRNGGDVDHWSLSPRTSARAVAQAHGPSSLLGRDAPPTLTATPTHRRDSSRGTNQARRESRKIVSVTGVAPYRFLSYARTLPV